jgi:hypothetical protein
MIKSADLIGKIFRAFRAQRATQQHAAPAHDNRMYSLLLPRL